MHYNPLGTSGLNVSCLGFGTHMNIGDTLDERQSREILRVAYEGGINLIDTADAYTDTKAEQMLGRCLPDFPRSDLVILTKVSGAVGPGPNDRGLSAKHIREACDASLTRLGLDYVDLYLCHHVDKETPLEETVRAMGGCVRAGKALYWGVSNWPAALVLEANALARDFGLPGVAVCEDRYNLLYRYPERLQFPCLSKAGVGSVTYSPLAHGMLAGIYKPGEALPAAGTRAALEPKNPVTSTYYNEDNRRRAQRLVEIANGMSVTAAALATAWTFSHPQVSATLLGAWNVDQLRENLLAANVTVPQDVAAQLDALFPLPPDLPTV